MKVTGGATLNAPIETVWTALNDPAVLVRTIPGCERLEATGTDSYRLTITTGMAAIRGTYIGEVSLADQQPPGSFTLKASGVGGPGTVSTDVKVRLSAADDGTTRLSYDADAVVGGVIAGVGQRMLAGVAKRMADQFFSSVDVVLTAAPGSAEVSAAVPTTVPAAQVGAGQTQPGVFVAPAPAKRGHGAGAGFGAGSGFTAGALVGGAIALAGTLVGAAIAAADRAAEPLMRPVTVAAVQVAPCAGPLTESSIKDNIARAIATVADCVAATGAELVVLPESVTTGFTPGISAEQLWDLVSGFPGPVIDPFTTTAAELGVHLVVGSYERGDERGVVYNSAVLAGPSGDLLGIYRKSHPFGGERADRGGWVTPGTDICVVPTPFGRVGLIICFDGDYPELPRITAIRCAEIICRPSALLRSADLWELTNRARAYDNHVYLVGANATGTDPAGVIYFGNSMIVTPVAEVVARAASHECWISARLDPSTALASLTPGSSVPQPFDHLADRNLALIRRHADALLGAAATPFEYGKNNQEDTA